LKTLFSPITWLNLRRSTVKVTKSIGKLGSGITKMWIIFAPGEGNVISLSHNSGTDNCRMLKIGMCTGHAKLNSPDIAKVKRS